MAAGGALLDAAAIRRVVSRLKENDPVDPVLASLTLREREVLALVAEGMSKRQIGERLHLAEKTIKNYVSGLLAKLGMQRRTQAAVFGAQVARSTGR